MADTNYQKDYSDFTGLVSPYTKPDSGRIEQEIRASAIVIALDRINTDDATSKCDIWFKDVLSGGDQSILTGIVTAHSGIPLNLNPIGRTRIVDTDTLDPDVAVSCTEDVKVDVAIEVPVSKKDVVFPFDINIIAAEFYVDIDDWTKEDYFEAWSITAGDLSIGALTAPAAQSDTIVNVSPTVFETCRPGYYVQFADQAEDKMYRVDSMDSGAGTITLNEELENAVDAGKTIHLRCPFVPRKYVKDSASCCIGDLQEGSSPLYAGDILRIHYYHGVSPTVVDWMAFTIIYKF